MNKKEIIGICEFLRVHHFENSYKLLDYYNKCNKQKEVIDKIKEKVKELDRFDPCGSMAVSMSISQFQEDLERLLEEIE